MGADCGREVLGGTAEAGLTVATSSGFGPEPPRDCGRPNSLRGWRRGTAERMLPEVRVRVVRMVLECEYGSRWAAILSIAGKIGCSHETLRTWVRRVEVTFGA